MTIDITYGVGPVIGLLLFDRVGASAPLALAPFVAIAGGFAIVAALRGRDLRPAVSEV